MKVIDICHEEEAITRTEIVRVDLWVESGSLVRHDVGITLYKLIEAIRNVWEGNGMDDLDATTYDVTTLSFPFIPALLDSCVE